MFPFKLLANLAVTSNCYINLSLFEHVFAFHITQALPLAIRDSHLTCKAANKCLNVREWVEVVECNKRWSPPFPCCPVNRLCLWKKTPTEKKIPLEVLYYNVLYVYVQFKQTNQICSPSNISKLINVEWRTCERTDKQLVNNSFGESKKKFGGLIKRETFQSKKNKDMGSEKYISSRFR